MSPSLISGLAFSSSSGVITPHLPLGMAYRAQGNYRISLEELEKDKAEYIEENKDAVVAQDISNPFVQQLKLNISSIEANIAAKTVLVEDYQNTIKELETAVDRVLRVEAEEKAAKRAKKAEVV